MTAASAAIQTPSPASGEPPLAAFFGAVAADGRASREALQQIGARWHDGYAPPLIDLARLLPSPTPRRSDEERLDLGDGTLGDASPSEAARAVRLSPAAQTRARITRFLEQQTGQRFGDDLRAWRRWMWSQPDRPHSEYARFKRTLYSRIDPRLGEFFPDGVAASIRLDEVDWGGVPVNGIPPLEAPRTIPAAEAAWLKDSHVIFGVVVNGEARAYPKRILAWHEMALDRLGGVDLTIVYCTLCGTVIPYESTAEGKRFTFGTSGLLYRSNKMMFDHETRSLWSALEGIPVVGPLVGSGVRLAFRPVVTTTWGEWRREHPDTTVLSLDTGFTRDYSEGAAYRDYFATDRLMFEVPTHDDRLKNKAEVLVLRAAHVGGGRPVAISIDLLRRQPVFHFEAGDRTFVVVTSPQGANRVYQSGDLRLASRDPDGQVRDSSGVRWRPASDALISERGDRKLSVPAHRAFWFGWHAQHPDTMLYH